MKLLATLLLLASASPPPSPVDRPVVVLAAASLQAPLEACFREFEKLHPGSRIELTTAATGALVREVEEGAPADVVVGASGELIDRLAAEGAVEAPVVIARNGLVLAVPASSHLHLDSLNDLLQPSIQRIGIGRRETVPAGQYAWESLAGLKLAHTLAERLVQGESVTQVLKYIEAGDVDVGFVYASDLHQRPQARIALSVPDELHRPISYPAAVIRRSRSPVTSRQLIDFLTSPAGQTLLVQSGLRPR